MQLELLPDFTRLSPALLAVVIATAVMFAAAVAFLCAAARLRRGNRRKAEMWGRLENRLDTVIGSVVHGAAPASTLHDRIRPDERIVLLDYLYKLLTRETRLGRRALLRDLARPYLGELEARARTGDIWQRARAIRTLAELAGKAARGAIMAGLDASEPHVAMTAARAYAQVGLGTVDPLLARLDRYHTWDRRLLKAVLASFGPAAVPALVRTLRDTTLPPHSRAVCADALVELDYDAGGDTAALILEQEDDVDLIAAALRLLGASSSSAQRRVVRQLCADSDEVVRGQAVACLARIGDDADLVGYVKPALSDPSPWVARAAARGLTERSQRAQRVPSLSARAEVATGGAVTDTGQAEGNPGGVAESEA